jgi:WD40 repeat protein/energy-coupling factor transporter ATP-binding protein EcfA2
MNDLEFKLNLAIVIGINDYQGGIPVLGTARQDAEAIATILKNDYQYQVHLLIDDQATRHNINQWLTTELAAILATANPSRLLFYFAGHGIALTEDEGPQGYLIPQDATLGDVDTYLSMQQVEAAISKLSCRHCLVILDCCFAGAFRWSSTRKLVPIHQIIHKERFDRFIRDAAWQVIASAASDQFALDSIDIKADRGISINRPQHSPFAAALMTALSGAADIYPPSSNWKQAGDGIITATELYLYLRDAIEIPTDAINQPQTPQIWCLKKHDKGEFIFLPPGHELNLPPAPSLDELEDHNPYRGLKSYETINSALFFGRTTLTKKLREEISSQPLTVVLGTSGSGKSSLLKAGLIAYLANSPQVSSVSNLTTHDWQVLTPIRPSESPLTSLGSVWKELGGTATELVNSSVLIEAIDQWIQIHPATKLLLSIDQLEELITLCHNDQDRQEFLTILADLLQAYPEVLRIVMTLRSDFEPQFRSTPLESLWQAGRFVVPGLSREELREVIEEPASAKVVYFESGDGRGDLVDQLIDEVAGMPGALPLLSFALSELYLKLARRYLAARISDEMVDRSITWQNYDELGGVTKSLTQRADEEYDALVKIDPNYGETIRRVMLRMVSVGGELARRQVPEVELLYPEPENTRVKLIVERFVAARLLVWGTDTNGTAYIEPAHDALVRGWEKLRVWKTEEEENLSLQRRLTPAAMEWQMVTSQEKGQPQGILDRANTMWGLVDRGLLPIERSIKRFGDLGFRLWQLLWRSKSHQDRSSKKSPQFLWNTNPYLAVLDKELQSDANWLNQVEAQFVHESVFKKRSDISWRWRITGSIILLLSVLILAALFLLQSSRKQSVSILIESANAQLLAQQELDSLMAAIKAGKSIQDSKNRAIFSPAFVPLPDSSLELQVVNALQRAGNQTTQSNRWKTEDNAIATSVVFSPEICEKEFIASASEDGTIEFRDFFGKSIAKPIKTKGGSIWSLKISPDCSALISGSQDGIVRLWKRNKITGIFEPKEQEFEAEKEKEDKHNHKGNGILEVAFSYDGNLIASAGEDWKVELWTKDGKWLKDIGTKYQCKENKILKILNEQYQCKKKEWHRYPEGQENLTDSIGLKDLTDLSNHRDSIYSVAFIPKSNNSQFVTAGIEGIKLWNTDGENGTFIKKLDDNWAYGVVYSADGSLMASGHKDGTIKIWEPNGKSWTPIKNQAKYRHQDGVRALSFSPDRSKIVSAGYDKLVKTWSISKNSKKELEVNLVRSLGGHRGEVRAVSFNKDSSLIASAGADSTIQLWKTESLLKTQQVLTGHEDVVYDVAFSHDRLFVATASKDTRVRVWQRNTDESYKLIFTSQRDVKNPENKEVKALAFKPKSYDFVSGNSGGEIIFWHQNKDNQYSESRPLSISDVNCKTYSKQSYKKKRADRDRHICSIRGISFNIDGSKMASISDEKVITWERKTDGLYKNSLSIDSPLKFRSDKSYALATKITSDGLVIAFKDGKIKLFKQVNDKFKEINTTTIKDNDEIDEIAISSNASKLATADKKGKIKIWQGSPHSNYQVTKILPIHSGNLTQLAFSPNDKKLATSSNGQDYTATIWDLDSEQPIILSGHKKRLLGVSFSGDGKKLASFSWDKESIIWNVESLDLFELDKLLSNSCVWMEDYLQHGDASEKNICLDISRNSQTK